MGLPVRLTATSCRCSSAPKSHREEEEQEKEEENDEKEIPVDSSGLFISILHPRNMRPQSLRPRLEEQEEQKRTGVG